MSPRVVELQDEAPGSRAAELVTIELQDDKRVVVGTD